LVLKILDSMKAWPEPKAFVRSMDEAFASARQRPFYISGFDQNGDFGERLVGSVRNIPAPTNFFTNQRTPLGKIERTLKSKGRAAIRGLQGSGKTQLALEYASCHLGLSLRLRQKFRHMVLGNEDFAGQPVIGLAESL
jgi:hypothetical protein